MTFAGDTPQLANVKAVDDSYPLYGDLQTTPPAVKPLAGTVLLAPRLMALLNLKTGDSIDGGCHAAYRRGGGAGAGFRF
jgi:putative ABC transport system permease protein